MAAQVKILLVLQEGELVRVGDTIPVKVDVRIVAATNRTLIKEVASGSSHCRKGAPLRNAHGLRQDNARVADDFIATKMTFMNADVMPFITIMTRLA